MRRVLVLNSAGVVGGSTTSGYGEYPAFVVENQRESTSLIQILSEEPKPDAKIFSKAEYEVNEGVQNRIKARNVKCFHASQHKKHRFTDHKNQSFCKNYSVWSPKEGEEKGHDITDWGFQCLGHDPQVYVANMEETEENKKIKLEEMEFLEDGKPMQQEEKAIYINNCISK